MAHWSVICSNDSSSEDASGAERIPPEALPQARLLAFMAVAQIERVLDEQSVRGSHAAADHVKSACRSPRPAPGEGAFCVAPDRSPSSSGFSATALSGTHTPASLGTT